MIELKTGQTNQAQGKTPNDTINEQQNTSKLLRIMTGYDQHASHAQLNAIPSSASQDIFTVLWEMKKKGLREATIKNTRKALSFLSKHSSLQNPEEVKGFIAGLERNESYKRNFNSL